MKNPFKKTQNNQLIELEKKHKQVMNENIELRAENYDLRNNFNTLQQISLDQQKLIAKQHEDHKKLLDAVKRSSKLSDDLLDILHQEE